LISFAEALARLLASASSLGSERVALDDADGRVLAEDLRAPAPMPGFDYSAMDGYAVARSDFAGDGPWRLPVRGESAAGGTAPAFSSGSACRIFTGAELPAGSDAVVPQEDVTRDGDSIELRAAPAAGAWIRRRGEDLAEGAVALGRGRRLGPGQVALAAALDRPQLLVARRPSVTVLATGDELRSPGEPARPGSIAESNAYFVAAAARRAGARARVGRFVRDDLELATRAVREGMEVTDVLVTIGGVSVGDHDVVRPALEAAGVTLDFWRVAIKPGKPLAVGRAAGSGGAVVHVLGLPGNPASASLTFLLFGVPLLRALAGEAHPLPPRVPLRVRGRVVRRAGREEFLRARLVQHEGERCAEILPNQASGAVTSFAEADALAVVPADRERVDDGDRLDAIRISDIFA
jgi:molybdopterin molybdotransferase